jgi:ribosome-associated protein
MPDRRDNDAPDFDEPPSKSARKREMLGLQVMGESLLGLNDNQLAQIPIEDEQLLSAIRECRQIRSNSARKRHLQFIGKLMRNIDPAPIEQALQALHNTQRQGTAALHQLEQLREDILAAGIEGVELAITRYPDADRQQLRQLILQHNREVQRQKPPAASRKLFRYLKELQTAYGDSDSAAG